MKTMLKHSLGWSTLLAIAGPGALGLWVVGRTASHYASTDPIAYAIAWLIGLGLVAGLTELALRTIRTFTWTTVARHPFDKSRRGVRPSSGTGHETLRSFGVGNRLISLTVVWLLTRFRSVAALGPAGRSTRARASPCVASAEH